jgi:hypothetical protein
MIIGFIGDMGTGKTLSAVAWSVSMFKLYGFRIYANIHIVGIPYVNLTLADLIKYTDSDEDFNNCIFIIDEAYIFMDARGSMSKRNQIIGYFITQTRKRNAHLFYTTQQYHQVDKRLRANTTAFAECSFKEIQLLDEKIYRCLNKFQILKNNTIVTKPIVFDPKPFFKYYDTRQVIRPI